MDLKQAFDKAAKDVQSLSQRPNNDVMLKLYSLFKQASEGDVQGKRPGMMNMVARAKYDAWQQLEGTSSEEAMTSYVKIVDDLIAKDS